MNRKKGIWWAIAFLIIFLLSQDYLFLTWKGQLSLLGLPLWIYWFGMVHLVFIAAFYWFAKKYWKE